METHLHFLCVGGTSYRCTLSVKPHCDMHTQFTFQFYSYSSLYSTAEIAQNLPLMHIPSHKPTQGPWHEKVLRKLQGHQGSSRTAPMGICPTNQGILQQWSSAGLLTLGCVGTCFRWQSEPGTLSRRARQPS